MSDRGEPFGQRIGTALTPDAHLQWKTNKASCANQRMAVGYYYW